MFWKRKAAKKEEKAYDPNEWKPVVRCSICNGEQVAGFRHLESGKFDEIMLIKNEQDMICFKETYGLVTVAKEY